MTDRQKQQIIRFRKEGFGYTAVANKVGISKDTVKSFCRRNGLAGEMAAQEDSVPGCRECGKPLQQRSGMKPRVFCSDECRVKWWHEHPEKIKQRAVYSFTCAGCGNPFTAYGNSRRKYCSHENTSTDEFIGKIWCASCGNLYHRYCCYGKYTYWRCSGKSKDRKSVV